MPALLTQVSMRPKRSIAAWPMRSTSAGLPTSATTVATCVPVRRSSLASWSSASPLRAASTSLAPLLGGHARRGEADAAGGAGDHHHLLVNLA
jgi:hypothetical protein